MAITLLEPPSPYLLPLLFFVVLFEVLLILGKRQRCKPLTLNIKALTLRKYELAVAMKGVSARGCGGMRTGVSWCGGLAVRRAVLLVSQTPLSPLPLSRLSARATSPPSPPD